MDIYWLEQIQFSDYPRVGDTHLSNLLQRGYPVLPGFVISAQVWQEFIKNLNSTEPLISDLPDSSLNLDVDNPYQLQRVAQRLRQEITTAPLPPHYLDQLAAAIENWQTPALIFRPSLVLPNKSEIVDGLLEAQVSTCDRPAMALALKRTWSQLFRARSLLYWQRLGIKLQQINLAILVQPLTEAIASGYVTYNSTKLEIQATWGLGIAIARGEVLPDSYLIDPETGALESQLGNKTIAYSLDAGGDTTPCLSGLQSYLLDIEQQQQYALEDKYLQQLIGLARQLKNQLPTFTLEWTLSQSDPPQLYLTQVTTAIAPLPTTPKELLANHTIAPAKLIRGRGAVVGEVVAPAYVVTNSTDIETLPSGVILVASAIAPQWLPLLQQVVGIVTEQGGLTSHCAILARELGIPAVIGAANATQIIQTGELVLLDGDRGEVNRLSTNPKKLRYTGVEKEITPSSFTYNVPIATQLLVNLSQPSLIERVKNLPIDGVGLLRSELMALTVLEGQHPNTWLIKREAQLFDLWQNYISQFARAFAPRPVFYRSLDWRSHEFQADTPGTAHIEVNPMLGKRGTFSYLQNGQFFKLELAALAAVQQSGYSNIHLLLPFVRTVEEFSFCRRLVEQAGLTQFPQFKLWMMAEVPSVLFLLPEYVKAGVQGVSIGTNDLTQLLLGVDRDSCYLAAAFDERHPAVMQAIAQIIQMATSANIPCSICGQAPALYPELIDSLVRWGITSISVEVEAVEQTYNAIARAEQRLILEAASRRLQSR